MGSGTPLRIASAGLAVAAAAGATFEAVARRRDAGLGREGRMVVLGGYSVRVYDPGGAGPVVLIVAGVGDCAGSWSQIRKAISREARVISYDRPGIGFSDLGPKPEAQRYVTELSAVINAAGIEKPFILVGHSLGGLIALMFARRYRDRVTGLLLVDPTPRAMSEATSNGGPALKAPC